ncbi:phosphoprotein ECPP44-like [Carya illinoinensis]|uniref:Dehydrin n=1 Tax=Carya illinoinensis TaxID=32201 RepID=A0A8T1PSA8_CARIL|nr:phosphoprotein ECPP44-like [Carya illinoinensis]KAG6644704.1 hypothetical protein CIPAW_08G071500 [Carya illinoinensis]
MAEEQHNTSSHEYQTAPVVDHGRQEDAVESKDRGLFDFLGKKEEEKPQEEVIGTKFEEKVSVSAVPEPKLEKEEYKEEKKGDVSEKLHRSNSSSSSSSGEEEGEGEEKKKKKKEKKGLTDKIKDTFTGDKKEEKHEDTSVPIERYEEVPAAAPDHHLAEPVQPEEKKGFVDKIKEKIPSQRKKTEEVHPPPPPASQAEYYADAAEQPNPEGEGKEKKGLLEKIKEKLPGHHPKTEEVKEKQPA